MNLTLLDAFTRFGAKPLNRHQGLSAMASDGAMVLNCSHAYFGNPERGVLRYEDRLSREPSPSKHIGLLGQHLTLARDGALPVRMVVTTQAVGKTRGIHVRPDLIGKVVNFDGDHFIIDFTRRAEETPLLTSKSTKALGRKSRV
jgi:hypothetical protein